MDHQNHAFHYCIWIGMLDFVLFNEHSMSHQRLGTQQSSTSKCMKLHLMLEDSILPGQRNLWWSNDGWRGRQAAYYTTRKEPFLSFLFGTDTHVSTGKNLAVDLNVGEAGSSHRGRVIVLQLGYGIRCNVVCVILCCWHVSSRIEWRTSSILLWSTRQVPCW
jgi:hypothetical protein